MSSEPSNPVVLAQQAFRESLSRWFAVRLASNRVPRGSFNEGEEAAVEWLFEAIARTTPESLPLRERLNLPRDVDKDLLVLAGVFPIARAAAEEQRRTVVYLAPDSESAARIRIRSRELMMLSVPEIESWSVVLPSLRQGQSRKLWIIGDLDLSRGQSRASPDSISAIDLAVADRKVAVLFVHQEGNTPVREVPAELGHAAT